MFSRVMQASMGVVMAGMVGGCAQVERATRGETPTTYLQPDKAYDAQGIAIKVSSTNLTLARQGLPPMKLEVDVGTEVTVNGYRSTMQSIPEGAQVRAKFQLVDEHPVAIRVDASSPALRQPAAPQGEQGAPERAPGTQQVPPSSP
jgi:hypothetical protein